jgi:hypothetical protein
MTPDDKFRPLSEVVRDMAASRLGHALQEAWRKVDGDPDRFNSVQRGAIAAATDAGQCPGGTLTTTGMNIVAEYLEVN